MRIYEYEIKTKLTGEVLGEDADTALRNLKGLWEDIKSLLRKIGAEAKMEDVKLEDGDTKKKEMK